MRTERKSVLIIDYLSLPEDIKKVVHGWLGFGNDCLIPFRTEFNPCSTNQKDRLTQENLEEYHKDQSNNNGFKGDFNKFIEDYGLKMEKFLIDQKIDLEGVEKILINICW